MFSDLGFVTFETIAEADAALEIGQHKLGEKEIEVKRAIANKYQTRVPKGQGRKKRPLEKHAKKWTCQICDEEYNYYYKRKHELKKCHIENLNNLRQLYQ